jgi:hypothetical protein
MTLLDGPFTTVKLGLILCHNGIRDMLDDCPEVESTTDEGAGYLAYSVPDRVSVDAVIDDLALMLTTGRLGDTNRE